MTKGVAVISEFNPFHNGHEYLFSKIKEIYPEKPIVCIMSGNLVQRGEVALFDKYKRAEAAIECGADLVIELPFPFSSMSAEVFAREATYIAFRSSLCDTLAFGSEIDDKNHILTCASRTRSDEMKNEIKRLSKEQKSISYPKLRENAYNGLYNDFPILNEPNFNLALEYAGEIIEKGYDLEIVPIKRYKCGFHDEAHFENFASASYIRKLVFDKKISEIEKYMPKSAFDILKSEINEGKCPLDIDELSKTFVYLLRKTKTDELSEYYGYFGISETAKKYSDSIYDIMTFVEKLKCKKYTETRIKRCVISLLFDIMKDDENLHSEYSVLLAADKKGTDLLKQRSEKGFPIFTKPAHIFQCDDQKVKKMANKAFFAEKIISECYHDNILATVPVTKTPYIKK